MEEGSVNHLLVNEEYIVSGIKISHIEMWLRLSFILFRQPF